MRVKIERGPGIETEIIATDDELTIAHSIDAEPVVEYVTAVRNENAAQRKGGWKYLGSILMTADGWFDLVRKSGGDPDELARLEKQWLNDRDHCKLRATTRKV